MNGAKKIILDLRDNPGGLLGEAINVTIFYPKGELVVTKQVQSKNSIGNIKLQIKL